VMSALTETDLENRILGAKSILHDRENDLNYFTVGNLERSIFLRILKEW
jgi:hypothetical protein